MKNLLVITVCLVFSILAQAQQEKNVESTITRVTVFLNRAQVTRELKIRVDAGKTNLVLSGLTSQLDQQSIQVSGKGNVVILGINHRQNFLTDQNRPKRLQVLYDSLEVYKHQLALEQNKKETLVKEEQLLISNQKIGGANQNLSVNELKAMADFYRTRMGDIGNAKITSDGKIKKLNEQMERINRQLRELTGFYSRNTGEIVVSLAAEAAGSVELSVDYQVASAGWYPVYDVRATNTKNPLQLNYKANVVQSSGEEWENVKLTLSTANPAQGGVKPELSPWMLDFYQPAARAMQGRMAGVQAKAVPEQAAMEYEVADVVSVAQYVQTVQSTLNTAFEIGLPYTVHSGKQPTLVDIRNHEVKATYRYSAVPKLDSEAFLMANATGWEEFSLLPGEANVFFEGTFIGKSFIDPNSVKDTLTVSLGRDKRIVVKREKVKDYTTRRAIGSSIRESYAWEISVRNTRNEPIRLSVEDQLPVSMNSQIEVIVVDLGGAIHAKDTGKLMWELNLQPNETRKLIVKYDVKYPKDKPISGL
jgi:uncharacterized protein (TIGR02231 family)